MKKLMSILLAFVMLCSITPFALAASTEATEAANALNALGLFEGGGTNADGTINYELDRIPTRQEAITMLVRLLGKEEEALAGAWETPFTDVADWAKPYIGYAYTNGLTDGIGGGMFGGESTVTASQYLTYVLRALGYSSDTDFQWDKAWELSDSIGLTEGQYDANSTFTRGDLAIVSNNALYTLCKGTDTPLRSILFSENPLELSTQTLNGTWYQNRVIKDDARNTITGEVFDSIFQRELIFDGNNTTLSVSYEVDAEVHELFDWSYNAGTYRIENNQVKFSTTIHSPNDIIGTETYAERKLIVYKDYLVYFFDDGSYTVYQRVSLPRITETVAERYRQATTKTYETYNGDVILSSGELTIENAIGQIKSYGSGEDHYTFQITVRNNSLVDLKIVSVDCSILDRDGNILGSTYATGRGTIKPGKTVVCSSNSIDLSKTPYQNAKYIVIERFSIDSNGNGTLSSHLLPSQAEIDQFVLRIR